MPGDRQPGAEYQQVALDDSGLGAWSDCRTFRFEQRKARGGFATVGLPAVENSAWQLGDPENAKYEHSLIPSTATETLVRQVHF